MIHNTMIGTIHISTFNAKTSVHPHVHNVTQLGFALVGRACMIHAAQHSRASNGFQPEVKTTLRRQAYSSGGCWAVPRYSSCGMHSCQAPAACAS